MFILGYVNPGNTTLEFDVVMYGNQSTVGTQADITAETVRFQNNIQSIFNRVRLLYGATPLEDIIDYNVIVRSLTEWTATNQTNTLDQTSITDGIGGYVLGVDPAQQVGNVNVRQRYIHGISKGIGASATPFTSGASFGSIPQNTGYPAGVPEPGTRSTATRRYQISFALGLFTQEKLVSFYLQ